MTSGLAGPSGRARALRGHAAMLGFSVAVSGSFSLGAMVANDIDPVALTAVRFLFAALLLGLLVAVMPGAGRSGRRGYAAADLAAPWRYALLAVLYGGYFVLMFEGLKTADPVAAGAVFTLTPLMAAAIAWPLLGQRLRAGAAGALAIGAAGAVWVIFRGDAQALARLAVGRGEAIYFVGCALHALYTPMLRRLNRGESALVTASLVTAAGFVLFLVYGWRAILGTDWGGLPPLVWVTLAYLVVFATAFAASAMQFAAQRLPSSRVLAYTYATPVWIAVWELALGHGVPVWAVMPGVALIVLALLMLLRGE